MEGTVSECTAWCQRPCGILGPASHCAVDLNTACSLFCRHLALEGSRGLARAQAHPDGRWARPGPAVLTMLACVAGMQSWWLFLVPGKGRGGVWGLKSSQERK